MRSRTPKVLQPLAGQPLLCHVLAATAGLSPHATVVVLGHASDQVRAVIPSGVTVALQNEPLGTGHAARCGLAALPASVDQVLVVYGDTALVRAETLRSVLAALAEAPVTLLTARLAEPRGYGRVIRDAAGWVRQLIEEAELKPEQRSLDEVVGGVLAFDATWLSERLPLLAPHPNGEYYLTDLVKRATDEGTPARAVAADDPTEAIGINDRLQLAQAHEVIYSRVRRRLLLEVGVSMPQPASVFVEPGVAVGPDTVLLPNTHLRGTTQVGSGCVIGPSTELVDTQVGDDCRISWSVLEQAVVRDDVQIGPFCHLRPGTLLESGVRLGNFVEVKNSRVGEATHAGHFSYIGDAELGRRVNVGAGTVTCNFDGVSKHRTIVGDDVFIGSDTMLVAPVQLGAHARTGAGSVVTHDVKDGQLVVGVPARPVPGRSPRQSSAEESSEAGVARELRSE